MSSEPVRQSANDLVAFDVRKQSPEQIAMVFARWKERKRREPQESLRNAPPHLMPVSPVAGSRGEAQAPQVPKAPRGLGGSIHYSTSFEEVLAARQPTLAQRVRNPDALPKLASPQPPRRRSRTEWLLLAGAASVFAGAAFAGGVLWEQSTERNRLQADVKPATDSTLVASPTEAVLPATPSYPMEIAMAEPFVATVTASAEADWPMQQVVDLALMTSAPVAETARLPLMPQLKPPVPVVQTASKAAQPQIEAGEPAIAPVELPLAAGLTTAIVSASVAQVADARPDGPIHYRNDESDYAFPDWIASSGPSGPAGSEADPDSGSAGRTGSGDPSGDTGGVGSETGEDPGRDGAGVGDSGGGTGHRGSGGGESRIGVVGGGELGGNGGGMAASGGGFGGGKSGGGTTGGDAGSGASGGGDTSGDAGRGGSGSGDSGGDGRGEVGGDDSGGGNSAKGGESGEGAESGEGESGEGSTGARLGRGIGGMIGDALGGLGGALGGEKGGANGGGGNSNDKGR